MAFNPNAKTLAACLESIKEAQAKHKISTNKIITSRDAEVTSALDSLVVTNVPGGFTKWQLPVALTDASTFYFSYGAPGSDVPEHSHDEGDGLRVILSGSIHYGGKELTAGDWMFLPKGTKYSFRVGKAGVGMFYCYSCCCA